MFQSPDPVEGVGFGINGFRKMGYLVGDKVSSSETRRLEGGTQGLTETTGHVKVVVPIPCWSIP